MTTTTQTGPPRILLVDDDEAILDVLRLQLRRRFEVSTAVGGEQALAVLCGQGPFAVIVSDMRMPGMDGAALLAEVRRQAPDTARVLLTGQADTPSAMAAVNDGQIFRFLSKPCPTETLQRSMVDAVAHHLLVTSERRLLEQTLRGAVKSLIAVLALANPGAFSRASRISQIVTELYEAMTGARDWEAEVTGMLAQIGAVTLPEQVLQKLNAGRPLSQEEHEMLARVPAASQDLLASIPRLEGVVAAIGHQRLRYDGTDRPAGAPRGQEIPLVSRILRVALDVDTLRSQRVPAMATITHLRENRGAYDPAVVTGWEGLVASKAAGPDLTVEVSLAQLEPGMTLMEDVLNGSGMLLLGRGIAITDAVVRRLDNHVRHNGLGGPILVKAPGESAAS